MPGKNTKDENERAAVWYRRLIELANRFKVRAVYDLSAPRSAIPRARATSVFNENSRS